MKKLLWVSASIIVLTSACKTKKSNASDGVKADSTKIWEAPTPASDNPSKYDSLKHELNKRRQKKKKN